MGPKVVPKRRSGITTTRCIITQKGAVLVYFAAEAWTHAWIEMAHIGIEIKLNIHVAWNVSEICGPGELCWRTLYCGFSWYWTDCTDRGPIVNTRCRVKYQWVLFREPLGFQRQVPASNCISSEFSSREVFRFITTRGVSRARTAAWKTKICGFTFCIFFELLLISPAIF